MVSKSQGFNVLLLTAVVGVFCGGVVKLFGTTVSSKFHSANHAVVNEVVFGGPDDFAPRPRSAVRPARMPHMVRESHESTFQDYGVHAAQRTAVDAVSTFAVDVDTASYAHARRALQGGYLPSPQSVRVEEFVNAFNYRDEAPTEEVLTAYLEAAPSPVSVDPDTYMLRVAVKAADLKTVGRKPWNLVFLVDVSGSMGDPDKIDMAREAMLTAVDHLRAGDSVALVTYAGATEVVLPATPAARRQDIQRAIMALRTGGGTNMGSGLELAYQEAAKATERGEMARVIVISDGDANLGHIGHDAMLEQISAGTEQGIKMTTVGVGDQFNDVLMEQLANKGNGNYVYLDGASQVEKVFGDELAMWMQDVANDVKIQVEFDPKAVVTWRQFGYENRAMADQDFRNDAKDGGEMGAGHLVTALYEVKLNGQPSDALATVRLRYRAEGATKHTEREVRLGSASVKGSVAAASDDLKFSAAVASFALMLKGAPEARHVTPEFIEELLVCAHGLRAIEFAELVKKTKPEWGRRS